jgi:hypothetical protein
MQVPTKEIRLLASFMRSEDDRFDDMRDGIFDERVDDLENALNRIERWLSTEPEGPAAA